MATLRRFVRVSFAAALMLAVGGCSRLSGDHDAEPEAEAAARMERLLDDMPESLTAKREKKTTATATRPEPAVASDLGPARGEVAPVQMPARPTIEPRPTAGRQSKKPTPSVKNTNEIPDAADVGL